MKFTISADIDDKPSIKTTLSVPVTEELKEEVERLKRSSKKNKKLVNEYSRQFFEQLVDKFDKGEFEKLGS